MIGPERGRERAGLDQREEGSECQPPERSPVTCIVWNSSCLRVPLCTKALSTSTIWKTWKCQGKFEIKF